MNTLIIVVIVVILFLMSVRVVQQGYQGAVERFGKFRRIASPGITLIIPFAERLNRVSVRSRTIQMSPSPVLTADNVSPILDAYFVFRVHNVRDFLYEIQNPVETVQAIMFSTIRRVVAEMHLSEAMAARDKIDEELRKELDAKTSTWGFKVEQVAIRDFQLPPEMKTAMEQQKIADAQRHAAINTAEGQKQSAILNAEGQRQAAITEAEGQGQAIITVADAQAKAIKVVYEAYLKAGATPEQLQAVLTVRSLEALEKVANGQATKILLPTELTGVAATLAALTEVTKTA